MTYFTQSATLEEASKENVEIGQQSRRQLRQIVTDTTLALHRLARVSTTTINELKTQLLDSGRTPGEQTTFSTDLQAMKALTIEIEQLNKQPKFQRDEVMQLQDQKKTLVAKVKLVEEKLSASEKQVKNVEKLLNAAETKVQITRQEAKKQEERMNDLFQKSVADSQDHISTIHDLKFHLSQQHAQISRLRFEACKAGVVLPPDNTPSKASVPGNSSDTTPSQTSGSRTSSTKALSAPPKKGKSN
jgi:hypothetical protein